VPFAILERRDQTVIGYSLGDPHVNESLLCWISMPHDEGGVLRVSSYPNPSAPALMNQWVQGAQNLTFQVRFCRACEEMPALMAPTPSLLR